MSETKISVEESKKMSLDEYISKAGITDVSKKQRRYNRYRKVEPMDQSDFDSAIPNASSQQWRLVDPNRPAGLPPLIPLNAKQKSQFNGYRNNNYRNRRRYQKQYADRDIPTNNNGVNRNNQPNFKHSINGNGASNALMPLMQNPNNAIAAMNNLAGIIAPLVNNGEYLNLFNTMMEKWEENRQIKNRPKYNMKAQKEIAEIQGKPFIYTCNSGGPQGVVSFDGPGVDDCTVKVVTTDTSFNQRFA